MRLRPWVRLWVGESLADVGVGGGHSEDDVSGMEVWRIDRSEGGGSERCAVVWERECFELATDVEPAKDHERVEPIESDYIVFREETLWAYLASCRWLTSK